MPVFKLRPATAPSGVVTRRKCPPSLGFSETPRCGDSEDFCKRARVVVEAPEALDVTHQARGYVSSGITSEDAPDDSLEWEDGVKPGDEIPTPLGPHALLGLLGKGTYGTVYRARACPGPEVALKVGDRAIRGVNLKALQGFTGDRHRNLVQYHAIWVGDEDQIIYQMMEILPGVALDTWMDSCEAITEPTVRQLMRQMVEAVGYMHQHNLMHRDVKPNNVQLVDVEQLQVKLMDLGSGCVIQESPGDEHEPCLRRAVVGGLGYMAPEVLSEVYDEKVDIWCLGVVLYELLSGVVPFYFDSVLEYKEVLRRVTAVDLTHDPFPMVGSEVKALLAKMLSFDPAARPDVDGVLAAPWFSSFAHALEKSTRN